MTVAALHGNKDQAVREQALADFKEGRGAGAGWPRT